MSSAWAPAISSRRTLTCSKRETFTCRKPRSPASRSQRTRRAGAPEGDAHGTVWLGTSVVSGTATARVLATGGATQFGDVVARLAARAPETEFERGLRHFGLLITRTVLVLVLVILAASLAMHRPAFESLLFAVALAVGLTPEFLPMITTVTLAQGAARMARQHVIVKRLSAIQDLGSIDILCSDKTGTLTLGEMRVEGSLDPDGRPSDGPLVLARLNSRFETGIRSPLDVAILAGAPPDDDDGMDETRRVAVRLRTASPFDRREARDGQPAGDQGSARLRLRDLRGRRGSARALAGARRGRRRSRPSCAGRGDKGHRRADGVDDPRRARPRPRGFPHVLRSSSARGQGGRRIPPERRRDAQDSQWRRRGCGLPCVRRARRGWRSRRSGLGDRADDRHAHWRTSPSGRPCSLGPLPPRRRASFSHSSAAGTSSASSATASTTRLRSTPRTWASPSPGPSTSRARPPTSF